MRINQKYFIAGLIMTSVVVTVLVLTTDVKALIFKLPKISQIQPTTKGSPFIFKTGLFNFRFSLNTSKKSFQTCPEIVGLCEAEYKKCRGLIDQLDQSSDDALLQAKNACVYSCDAPPAYCFGLVPENEDEKNGSQTKLCDDSEKTSNCVDADGQAGKQSAKYCDTATGNWIYDVCIVTNPIEQTPPSVGCQGSQPTCPSGYTGSYVCNNGQWTSQCQPPAQPQCSGTAPTCPAGTTGSYVCSNGSWVSQCQPIGGGSNCPELNPDYNVCIMSDGRYGREYTDYCNETTGEWVFRPCNVYPNLQPTCTSFTYTDWSTCSSGNQGRTIVTREPYGCAGGSPVTYQSCCSGVQPSCPTGWTGSYTCSQGTWWNTCTPDGISSCYRGVSYKTRTSGSPDCPTCNTYAKCVGTGNMVDGKMCLINSCSSLQPWIPFSSDSSFRGYVDTIYNQTIPNSCDPSFTYTQCQ
ncbi:hypothetical protein KKG46_03570 [Patescibacteria group bacterium]|nr:hypothetical protein [Patescibacteria group bacterium]